MKFLSLCLLLVLLLTSCGVSTPSGVDVDSSSDGKGTPDAAHTHTPVAIEGIEPECNVQGLSEGEKCSECGEILLAQIPLAAKGHNMVKQSGGKTRCSVCGMSEAKLYDVKLEDGTIAAKSGEAGANKARFRTADFIPIESFEAITIEKGYKITWFAYDTNKKYIGNGSNTYPTMPTGGEWLPDGEGIAADEILAWNKNAKYVKFAFCKTNGADISLASDTKAADVKIYSSGYEIPAPTVYTYKYKGDSLGTTNVVTAAKVASVSALQDGATYGGYFFAFTGSGTCKVYSTEDYSLVSSFTLEKVKLFKPHSNSVCFGSTKYKESDEFPLLYANVYNNYGIDDKEMIGVCGVYRIVRDGDGFKSTLVQVIKVGFTSDTELWASKKSDVRPYGNFVVDTDRNKLIAFTMRDEDSSTRFFEFDIPAIGDGEYDSSLKVNKVTLTKDDITDKFSTPYFRYLQGCTYYGGKVYSLEGFTDNAKNPASLKIVDLEGRKLITEIKLQDMGLTVEPEAAFVVDGELYYAEVSGNIYKFTFH